MDKISVEKNVELECYRVLTTAAVAILHFSEDYTGTHGIICGGYLGVDFFFILSGYFLMLHWLGQERGGLSFRNTAAYFWHRLKRLYPPFLIATVLMQLIQWAFDDFGIRNLISGFWKIRWQFLMCHFLGAPTVSNMRSVWYLSSLSILMWVVYYLIDRDLDLFLGIVPVADILILVYIFRTFGTLSMQSAYILAFNGGLLRGFAEMTIGAVVAYVVYETNKGMGYLMGCPVAVRMAVRVCCWFLISFVMVFHGFDEKDFVVIPAMAVLLLITGVYPIRLGGGILTRGVLYLGKISYWVYLLHLIVSYMLARLLPGRNYMFMLGVFGILVVGIASGCMYFYNFALQGIKRVWKNQFQEGMK